MGIKRKSRELIIQTLYSLLYADVDEYLQNLDLLNKYKEVLSYLCEESAVELKSNIYNHADFSLKKIIPLIDELQEKVSSYLGTRTIDSLGQIDLIILKLSMYEMLYEKTPPPVMINEAIELAKKFCSEKSPALINAILDNFKKKELTITTTIDKDNIDE
ncbi:MAG: transcription antitermination factor NusB [Candidatus Cloacimonetes bacterium]|nr:transcription antitermination factor NusB [Candidatus Cloacimonadota bacterium]MDD4156680.1 transcription antitermination factor NusB [Candidatus Cloacimonadota bacterium]